MRDALRSNSKSPFFATLESTPFLKIIGVHCALSAGLAYRNGAKALWLSGLGMSTIKGLRDANELSWTDAVSIAQDVCSAQPLPTILDADNGYGDFNNARLLALRAHKVGISGISIEDKPFPKINSFSGSNQKLEPTAQYCAKLKSIKDALGDSVFLIARTEALICNMPVQEALSRAVEYISAGADAIIVHSKFSSIQEIESFTEIWQNKAPLFVIPTTFISTKETEYFRLKINAAIYANFTLRSSITAMEKALSSLIHAPSSDLANAEKSLTTMSQIFNITGLDNLEDDRQRYCGN